MQHVSEVVKILEGAVRRDPQQAVSYAQLLADKLDREGAGRQAKLLRDTAAKARGPVAGPAGFAALPTDRESALATVDEEMVASRPALVLSDQLRRVVDEFVGGRQDRDVLISHGLDASSRLLLHGPPGTGKTSLARQIAHDLDLPLLVSRSDALVSSLLGQTARNIRDVFDYARGQPCVLFLDEFDSLAKKRSDGRDVGELQRVVIALIENIDRLDPDQVLIAATNHPELLDEAIWRRFDVVAETTAPDAASRAEIWRLVTMPVAISARTISLLTANSEGMSGAAIETAGLDISRVALIRFEGDVSAVLAMHRLFMYKHRSSVSGLSIADEIKALRAWLPDVFSTRSLSAIFGISTRQVQNALGDLS